MAERGSGIHQGPLKPRQTPAGLVSRRGHGDAMRTAPMELWNEGALLIPLQPRPQTSPTQLLD